MTKVTKRSLWGSETEPSSTTDSAVETVIEQHASKFALDYCLTPRETDVLHIVCRGMKNQTMARHLYIEVPTIRLHLRGVYKKTRACDKTDLVISVWRHAIRRSIG